MHTPSLDARPTGSGFGLLEVVVTREVAATLLAIAIPSYRSAVGRDATPAVMNDFVGDMNFARSQAVTRGRQVYTCTSRGNSRCDGNRDWGDGRIIYAPVPGTNTPTPATVLRAHNAGSEHVEIAGRNDVASRMLFDANGFAMGSMGDAGRSTARAAHNNQQTGIDIAPTGRIHTQTVRRGNES